MKSFLPIFLVLLVVSSFSCTRKHGPAPDTRPRTLTTEAVLDSLIRGQVAANWVEAKGKVDFQDPNRSIGAQFTMRMRRDSVIWISVKKLGFEGARLLMTPDSAWAINRLTNEYARESVESLLRRYKLPGGFQTLQAILLGNPVFLTTHDWQLTADPLYYLLTAEHHGKVNRFQLRNTDFSLAQMDYSTGGGQPDIHITQQQYQPHHSTAGGGMDFLFSYFRQINISPAKGGETKIELNFSKVELDVPQTFPFRIPPHYTRMADF